MSGRRDTTTPQATPDDPAAGSDVVLGLVDVTKHYPGEPPIRAVDGVTLAIRRGELVAVVGASGSGKSTLLNIVGTLDRPTSGAVWIDGHDVNALSDAGLAGLRATSIGFVFQQFHLLESATALHNVANGLLYRGVSRGSRQRRAAAALELVGLGHRVHHRASKLSGGERQRVAIARAVVGDPAIVLADEPTGNLDSVTSADIVRTLRSLHERGTTVVIITHDRELAAELPRQVAVSDGRVVSDSGDTLTQGVPA